MQLIRGRIHYLRCFSPPPTLSACQWQPLQIPPYHQHSVSQAYALARDSTEYRITNISWDLKSLFLPGWSNLTPASCRFPWTFSRRLDTSFQHPPHRIRVPWDSDLCINMRSQHNHPCILVMILNPYHPHGHRSIHPQCHPYPLRRFPSCKENPHAAACYRRP